ncbi:MAG: hypothetical protein JSR97_00105, partial [Verrucomicrobia bacterium]|nr:hypothetical protein [Verrucomicrobiota bacterium]
MQIFCKLYSRIIYCDNKTSSADVTTTADYLVGFVYKSKSYSSPELSELAYSKKLQFFSHEEGRVRPLEGNNETPFVYDYFIKDHLGNVRMVLTEEEKQDKYPVASLEDSKIEIEKSYYDINTSNVADKSEAIGITDYVNDNGIGNNPKDDNFSSANSDNLYKLNSNTAKTGLGITLKVMAGDRIDVFGKSYYFENTSGTGGNSPINVLDLLNSFLNTPAAAGTTHGITGPDLNNTVNLPGINGMISQQSSQSNAAPNKPRAFINVIFFDEQFKSYNFKLSMAG